MEQEAETWRQGGFLPDTHEAASRTAKADDEASGGARARSFAGAVDPEALPQVDPLTLPQLPGKRQR